jgi:hypothetical protein
MDISTLGVRWRRVAAYLWLYVSAAGPGPWSLDALIGRVEPRDWHGKVSISDPAVRRSA